MTQHERRYIALLLASIVILVGYDLFTDTLAGARWWHVLTEISIALAALIGAGWLLRGTVTLRTALHTAETHAIQWHAAADQWRQRAQQHIDGLRTAIDTQFSAWQLTPAEHEVALLLLKGFSLKEIADLRTTAEKTTRAHATNIYAKSGVTNRSELAAFFLEDLLEPDAQRLHHRSDRSERQI